MRSRTPPALLDEESLFDYAVKLLGQQMRTVAEVKRLLRRRVEAGETGEAKIESVIGRLKDRRYLDDSGYAADYARLRQENSSFGKRRVQQDLMRKGVQSTIINKTLESAYENVSEEELARRHLERKRIRQPTSDKETARVVRLLVRGGFSTGVIFRILKQWDVDDSALANLDSIETGDSSDS
jgi:regulatory protein